MSSTSKESEAVKAGALVASPFITQAAADVSGMSDREVSCYYAGLIATFTGALVDRVGYREACVCLRGVLSGMIEAKEQEPEMGKRL